jgi:hypothetical protein
MQEKTDPPPVADSEMTLCSPFALSRLKIGSPDKLGNIVQEILWLGAEYAIYRSNKGVYVHFSDCPEKEEEQRQRFTEICPELCELRYLTTQMGTSKMFPHRIAKWWRQLAANDLPTPSERRYALFEQNMAQALMLIMEKKTEPAKEIAQQALAMAVERVTNDNTVRYLRASLGCAAVFLLIGFFLLYLDLAGSSYYIISCMFGSIGAIFSIATRLQAFELKPCNESTMNYWMSAIRVGMGVVGALVLLLLASTTIGETIIKQLIGSDVKTGVPWQTAAILGFLAGFAERLVPNLLQRSINKIESPDDTPGTPVQVVRRREINAK